MNFQVKNKLLFKVVIYTAIFIFLVLFYAYFWTISHTLSNGMYCMEQLKRDFILSLGLALISTLGIYFTIFITKKNANKTKKND